MLAALAATMLPGQAILAQGLEYVKANYTKYEYRIPMRDGKRLFTAVYVPKDQSHPWPIMLVRTPYSVKPYGADQYQSDLRPSPLFAKSGYIFAYQDVRGRWMSEGEFVNMRPALNRDGTPNGQTGPHPRPLSRNGRGEDRRIDRHVGHHRLAGEARPQQQRQGGDVGHFLSRASTRRRG